ncbi:MAG: tRNA (adenosine(37)-N6)-threonylcarbamoyltransferase complex ATPase subunit type 1 TsaE [Minisyncoccota bacterium]
MREGAQKEVKNLGELRTAAEGFLRWLASGASKETATVVGLSGDLGAGKTAFVKCVAAALGIEEVVTSPTFILEKVYLIPRDSVVDGRFLKLIHVDAYRLHSGDEMRALDWSVILADKTNLVFLEWPEQVADALPQDMINLSFEYVGEGVRRITGDFV